MKTLTNYFIKGIILFIIVLGLGALYTLIIGETGRVFFLVTMVYVLWDMFDVNIYKG